MDGDAHMDQYNVSINEIKDFFFSIIFYFISHEIKLNIYSNSF
jgi:hypothetical protein